MAEQPIRIGFIGAGSICKSRHFPGLAKIAGVEIKTVCNRSEESSRRVAKEWSIPEIDTDWRQLLARDDLDAVFIGTWPYMHMEMSIAALEAGKHVFCQARMAMDLAEAKAMVAAAEKYPGLVHMICPPPHRMPWEPYIKRMLDAGELGEVREVRAISLNDANLNPDRITWRERVEFSGKQVLAAGIVAETLNAWVGEYETLNATTATPIPTKTDEDGKPYEIRIPQIAMMHGTLQSGAVITEHHSGVSPHIKQNVISIVGSKGTLRVTPMQSIEFAKVSEELKPVDVPESEQRDWHVEEDFINAVRQAQAGESWHVSPDFHEGLKYMRKIEALHRAAETGKAVRVADL
ncbi:MAG: Gfo/Idh/MocA family protein [Phycisphaeraceae bacterium]